MSSAPVWLLALVAAAVAPYLVGAIQAAMERRVRQRTLDVIARAGLVFVPTGRQNAGWRSKQDERAEAEPEDAESMRR